MKYEKIKYPDGQISAKITDFAGGLQIRERINSYEDLIFIRAIAEAIKFTNVQGLKTLFVPCLFGQRSDRRFGNTQSHDLKVIAEILNNCGFDAITIFDPHSSDGVNLIHQAGAMSPLPQVRLTLLDIDEAREDKTALTLVSPDAGAYKKVFSMGEEFNLPVVAAVKHRDLEGKIDLKFIGDVAGKECLIVDDLCDGGYTFILLSKALKQQGAKKVYLYISHAYFSKGLDVLKEHIDHVYCTNSVKDIEDPFVTQFCII